MISWYRFVRLLNLLAAMWAGFSHQNDVAIIFTLWAILIQLMLIERGIYRTARHS